MRGSAMLVARAVIGLVLVAAALVGPSSGGPSPAFAQRASDSDGDGVPDDRDACLHTPRSATLIDRGCSAMELVIHPDVVFDPVAAAIERVRKEVGDGGRVFEGGERVEAFIHIAAQVASKVESDRRLFAAGDVCGSAASFGRTDASLVGAHTSLATLIRELGPRLLARDRPW